MVDVKFMKRSYRYNEHVLDVERFSSSGIWIVSSASAEIN